MSPMPSSPAATISAARVGAEADEADRGQGALHVAAGRSGWEMSEAPPASSSDGGNSAIPREQVEQTAAGVRRLLEQISDGTLTAGSSTVARLEGALAALDGPLGHGAGLLPQLLQR